MTITPSTTDRGGAFVHVGGIDIHYVERGAGEPLVLLHGGMMSTGPAWDGAPPSYVGHMDALAAHFRVIAPDTRASGATVHKEGTASMSVLADDVVGLIDALGLDRPMVCGFSEGGLTATLVGIRYPGSVRAIVNDAGFDMLDPQSHTFPMSRVLLGGAPDATEPDPDAAAAFLTQNGMGDLFETMRADYDAAQGEGYWRRYFEILFPRWTQPPDCTVDDLPGVTAPTLVLTGDRDMFCSVEDAVATYRNLPHGELCVLANQDHAINDAAIDATIDFLTRHAEA